MKIEPKKRRKPWFNMAILSATWRAIYMIITKGKDMRAV